VSSATIAHAELVMVDSSAPARKLALHVAAQATPGETRILCAALAAAAAR